MQDSYIGTSVATSAVTATSADDSLTGVNMVSYNMNTGATNYDYFDSYSYEQKTSVVENTTTLESDVELENSIENDEVTSTCYSDENISYTEGYTPIYDINDDTITDSDIVSPDTILGDDDRTQVTDPKSDPYRKTGQIVIKYYNVLNQETGNYVTRSFIGTAFLVGENIAVTAGHCVYDDVTVKDDTYGSIYEDNVYNPRFADKIEFYFGVNGISERNENYKYYAVGVISNIEYSYYISESYSEGYIHDWAVVELDRNIGKTVGWHGYITGLSLTESEITTHGYPGDKTAATMWETTGTVSSENTYKCYHDIDIYPGQSGSPCIITYNEKSYVCAVNTTEHSAYNSGTKISTLIYNFISSYKTSRDDEKVYDYPSLSILGKSGGTWLIKIENTSSMGINLIYNSKMCFLNDAATWSSLSDLVTVYLAPYSSTFVGISENWFATSITCSYIHDGYRIISYANNLSTSGSLTRYINLIAV